MINLHQNTSKAFSFVFQLFHIWMHFILMYNYSLRYLRCVLTGRLLEEITRTQSVSSATRKSSFLFSNHKPFLKYTSKRKEATVKAIELALILNLLNSEIRLQ